MKGNIVLASRSPRRLELLARIGVTADVRPADIDESPRPGESPPATALRLAEAKARSVRADDHVVLAADTIVSVADQQLGKPTDDDDASRMLRLLAGRTHEVTTAVAVLDGGRVRTQLSTTHVRFRQLTDDEVGWYVASGEWRDKAGAYALQGRAAAFVESIHGSHTNVIGLPLDIVVHLLRDAGCTLLAPDHDGPPTLAGRGEDEA